MLRDSLGNRIVVGSVLFSLRDHHLIVIVSIRRDEVVWKSIEGAYGGRRFVSFYPFRRFRFYEVIR
jgi:hypothetical protein